MLGRPMEEALDQLPLSPAAKQTLLGRPSAMRSILDSILAQEVGDWADVDLSAANAGGTPAALSNAYIGALRWARALTRPRGR